MRAACVFLVGALWIPSADARPRKTVQADDSFNGRQVELNVGETLELSLSENASTGFRWMVPPESAHKFEKQLAEGAGGPPGKPGIRHFYFEALEPGTVELELDYRRPWEAGKPPARKFKLRVRIRVRPASGPASEG